MSINSLNDHEKWKKDLEIRCEEYVAQQLFYKTDAEIDLELSIHRLDLVTTALALNNSRVVVEVQESKINPGTFQVSVNGQSRKIFSGWNAHAKASTWASELLNGQHGPL